MKELVVMRGIPGSGKSFRAKEILEQNKKQGIEGFIYSTDEYFYTQVKPENPDEYNFVHRYLGTAHKWNLLRAQKSVEQECPLIIIDNTNTTASECKSYVEYGHYQGYEIKIEEPKSDWWQKIRILLKDRKANKKELKKWAAELATKNVHNVPFWSIDRMMWRWQSDITLEQILNAPSY